MRRFSRQISSFAPALAAVLFACIFASPRLAEAKPTQNDVFRSIEDSVSESSDSSGPSVWPWVCGGLGVVIVVILIGRRQNQQIASKAVNNRGKLLRELVRVVPLKPKELKQIKTLADELPLAPDRPLASPLVLLLCPSVLEKAVREKSTRADRKTLHEIARQLRGSGH